MFDEAEDLPEPLPRQEIERPEFVLDIPKEIKGIIDDGEFEINEIETTEPIENWEEVLASIEYSGETIEITDQQITLHFPYQTGDIGRH